jgi:hypothetical protein
MPCAAGGYGRDSDGDKCRAEQGNLERGWRAVGMLESLSNRAVVALAPICSLAARYSSSFDILAALTTVSAPISLSRLNGFLIVRRWSCHNSPIQGDYN